MAEEFEGKIVFFGVTNNDTVDAGRDYVRRFRVPYRNGNAPKVWEMFGNPFRPSTIVFDVAGEEVHRVTGPVEADDLRPVLEEVTKG